MEELPRIAVGQQFDSFADAVTSLKMFGSMTNQVFVISNKNCPVPKSNPLHKLFPYKTAHFRCKHGGTYRAHRPGHVPSVRPNQFTAKLGCPVRASFKLVNNKIELVHLSDPSEHNHPLLDNLKKPIRNNNNDKHVGKIDTTVCQISESVMYPDLDDGKFKVGDRFASIADATKAVRDFGDLTNQKFVIARITSRVPKSNPFHDKFPYRILGFNCKHGGTYRSHRPGVRPDVRPNQSTSKLGCPVQVSFKLINGKMELLQLSDPSEHNHPLGEHSQVKIKRPKIEVLNIQEKFSSEKTGLSTGDLGLNIKIINGDTIEKNQLLKSEFDHVKKNQLMVEDDSSLSDHYEESNREEMNHPTFKLGDRFGTFRQAVLALKTFGQSTGQKFVMSNRNCSTAKSNPLKAIFPYSFAQFQCKHSGNYRGHRSGFTNKRRKNPRTTKTGCPVKAHFKLVNGMMEVSHLSDPSEHNHPLMGCNTQQVIACPGNYGMRKSVPEVSLKCVEGTLKTGDHLKGTLKPGDQFESHAKVLEALKDYGFATKQIFVTSSKSCVSAKSNPLHHRFPYTIARFQCKHGGTYRGHNSGLVPTVRPNQTTTKTDCPVKAEFKLVGVMMELVHLSDPSEHNHSLANEDQKSIKQIRIPVQSAVINQKRSITQNLETGQKFKSFDDAIAAVKQFTRKTGYGFVLSESNAADPEMKLFLYSSVTLRCKETGKDCQAEICLELKNGLLEVVRLSKDSDHNHSMVPVLKPSSGSLQMKNQKRKVRLKRSIQPDFEITKDDASSKMVVVKSTEKNEATTQNRTSPLTKNNPLDSSKISLGQRFQSFPEAVQAIHSHGRATNQVFVISNQSSPMTKSNPMREKFPYRSARYRCKHGGTYRCHRPTMTKRIRPNQSTAKTNCPVEIHLKLINCAMEVVALSDVADHNHTIDMKQHARRPLTDFEKKFKVSP